jgi:hypothetical protein
MTRTTRPGRKRAASHDGGGAGNAATSQGCPGRGVSGGAAVRPRQPVRPGDANVRPFRRSLSRV